MHVKVFLNREKDEDGRLAIFSRRGEFGESVYRKGDKLERVYEYDEVGDFHTDRVLNRAYSDFNRGSSTFVGDAAYPERSLSAGDVVEVDGVRFAVERFGFKEVK